jgi:hypothetical protein
LRSLLLLSLAACNPPIPMDTGAVPDDTGRSAIDTAADDTGESGDTDSGGETGAPDDVDGDGFTVVDGDCDDADAARFPGAPERLDGRDDDCDGAGDEGDAAAFAGATRTDGAGSLFGAALGVGPDTAGDPAWLAVGAPGEAGVVYVFGLDAIGAGAAALDAHYTLTADAPNGGFGSAVSFASLDGDVYTDLLVGAPTTGAGSGALYVLDGSRVDSGGSGSADTTAYTVAGDATFTGDFGRSVQVLGEDAFVGAPGESLNRGAMYRFAAYDLGRGNVGSTTDGTRVAGTPLDVGFGYGMGHIDWDGDGTDDLVVTAPGASNGRGTIAAGTAYVWTADMLPLLQDGADTSTATATVEGQVFRTYLAYPFVGDFDGDGSPELGLASYLGPDLAERTIVVLPSGGTGAISTETARFSVTGLALPDVDGPGVGAADLDADGKDDLLVGDHGNSPGRVLVFGSGSVLLGGALDPADASARLDGPALYDAFGATVLGLQVTGSDTADLLVGAPMFGDGALYAVPSYF